MVLVTTPFQLLSLLPLPPFLVIRVLTDLTVGTGGGQAVGVAVYGDGIDVSVTDGAGNDTITLSATSLLSRTTLFGGAGEDNLTVGNASGTGEVISSSVNGNAKVTTPSLSMVEHSSLHPFSVVLVTIPSL